MPTFDRPSGRSATALPKPPSKLAATQHADAPRPPQRYRSYRGGVAAWCALLFAASLFFPPRTPDRELAADQAQPPPEADPAPQPAPAASQRIDLHADTTLTVPLPALQAGRFYSILIWLPSPSQLHSAQAIHVSIADARGQVAGKSLHPGDTDFYLTLSPRQSGDGAIVLCASAGDARQVSVGVECLPIPIASRRGSDSSAAGEASSPSLAGPLAHAPVQLGTPRHDWRDAQPIALGTPVFCSADDRPYLAPPGDPRARLQALWSGIHWYTFTYDGDRPQLVHIDLDILDRDVPVDVALFTRQGEGDSARLVPYMHGVERFAPELSTQFHGLYKFIARVITPGTYYLRVMGNHPAYTIRTELYDPPPYDDPRQAVRVGMDYLIRKGDSWHANTPRRGGVVFRDTQPLGETAQCIACHPTHFTTRGELIAIGNGYPLRARHNLQFLTERLYNNPRPLYGMPDAAWVRMISAAGNVSSRLAYMEILFEHYVSGERREGLLEDIGNYLARYWPAIEYPETESNGNLPRISGFEIALHSAVVFEELYRRTGDERWMELRRQTEEVAVRGEPIDMIDLCWKTIALATFDREGYAEELEQLVEQIFSYQREDARWSMVFAPEVRIHDYRTGTDRIEQAPTDAEGRPLASDFQTYHSIYALATAGVTSDDPRLARAVEYCLAQQQPWGGWQGNPDFKNFDTPFRDTQYAIMALSELFPLTTASPDTAAAGQARALQPVGSAAETAPRGTAGLSSSADGEHEAAGGATHSPTRPLGLSPTPARGWMAGFPPAPEPLPPAEGDVPTLLAALDQHWQRPSDQTMTQVRALLDHPLPLVRQAAASCVGRLADEQAVPQLAARLGDPSKMVQRAAAWALRQIATRRSDSGTGVPPVSLPTDSDSDSGTGVTPVSVVSRRRAPFDEIRTALASPDDRTRWGAIRVFNQHFRYLADDWSLAEALIDRFANDPLAVNRMEAGRALWQWWFWDSGDQPPGSPPYEGEVGRGGDGGHRGVIEDAFLAALARDEHPCVRRAAIEGLHNVLDDNERYLYNTWIRQLASDEDRQRVQAGHRAVVAAQARRIADALTSGNELLRDGVLRAYYAFHLREGGADPAPVIDVPVPETLIVENPTRRDNDWIDGYRRHAAFDPLTMGTATMARIGNDSEPPVYYADSGPIVSQALAAVLDSCDPPTALDVVRMLKQTQGVPLDALLAARMLTAINRAPPELAAPMGELAAGLLPQQLPNDDQVTAALAGILTDGHGPSVALAGTILSNPANRPLAERDDVTRALAERLTAAQLDDPDLPSLLEALIGPTPMHLQAAVVQRVFAALNDGPPATQAAAVRTIVAAPGLAAAGAGRLRWDRCLEEADAARMQLLLREAAAVDLARYSDEGTRATLLGVALRALEHADPAARRAAIEAVRAVPALQENAGIQSAVRALVEDHDESVSSSAASLVESLAARGGEVVADPAQRLDYDFFVREVQPILLAAGEDNQACVQCHANHAIFRLHPPPDAGTLSDEQLRENYLAALRVVEPANPEESLILLKPTSPFAGIGVPGNYRRTHGGDIRWPDATASEEYRTILRWIQGARVEEDVGE